MACTQGSRRGQEGPGRTELWASLNEPLPKQNRCVPTEAPRRAWTSGPGPHFFPRCPPSYFLVGAQGGAEKQFFVLFFFKRSSFKGVFILTEWEP